MGDTFKSAEREVTTADIERFAALTGDTFYAHMSDTEAARNPLFGSRVAHGYFLISAAAGLFVDPDYGPVLGNYGLGRAAIRQAGEARAIESRCASPARAKA